MCPESSTLALCLGLELRNRRTCLLSGIGVHCCGTIVVGLAKPLARMVVCTASVIVFSRLLPHSLLSGLGTLAISWWFSCVNARGAGNMVCGDLLRRAGGNASTEVSGGIWSAVAVRVY
jgi:hypothetical protein